MERIPYGLRRYWLLVGVFTPILAWMAYMAATIVEPTFVFPLGRLPPGPARIALGAVAALGAAFVGWSTWLRFVRRPDVVLAADRVELPIGEFGTTSVTLRRGTVRKVALLHGAAGWRRLRVDHDGGTLFVEAARLPDEASFDAVHRALEALGT